MQLVKVKFVNIAAQAVVGGLTKSEQKRIVQLQRAQEREAAKIEKARAALEKELNKKLTKDAAVAEVEAFESALEELQSLHKICSSAVNWKIIVPLINPHPPIKGRRQGLENDFTKLTRPDFQTPADDSDETMYQTALREHHEKLEEYEGLRAMAGGVLEGSLEAYSSVLQAYTPFHAVEKIGSEVTVTWGDSKTVSLGIALPDRTIVPDQIKILTSAGKVSSKAMPKARVQEIYHDFVCSCVLRLAREAFAWLPLETILITVWVENLNPMTNQKEQVAVFSGAMTRENLSKLDFASLDPSDSMEIFTHRGDMRSSKKTGSFVPILPLSMDSYLERGTDRMIDLETFRTRMRSMSKELKTVLGGRAIAIDETEEEELV